MSAVTKVTVRRNDGGLLRDTAETMVYSLRQLMEFASKATDCEAGASTH